MAKKISPDQIDSLENNQIFVFGSNFAGVHGAGAAKKALEFGAVMGQGVGIMGNSYAIPTKDENIKTISLDRIMLFIDDFLAFAEDTPEYDFLVTAVGCGLAGYEIRDIAPLFKNALFLENVSLPKSFLEYYVYNMI